MTLEFSGKKALILGGSCEMGCLLAEKMAAAGIFPLMTYNSKAGQCRMEKRIAVTPIGRDVFHFDLSDKEPSLSMLEKKIAHGIDYLVDFAHGDFESLVAGAEDDAVTAYFNANVSVRALAVKRVSRVMLRQKKGKMIFISSTAAGWPNPGQGFYAAAKLASEAIYKNIGLELGKKGITTLAIRPGYICSGRGKAYLETKGRGIKTQVPAGLILEPEQVADAVMFFLSDQAGRFNATRITLDGGFSAGKTIN